jgi:hypothetical protein
MQSEPLPDSIQWPTPTEPIPPTPVPPIEPLLPPTQVPPFEPLEPPDNSVLIQLFAPAQLAQPPTSPQLPSSHGMGR